MQHAVTIYNFITLIHEILNSSDTHEHTSHTSNVSSQEKKYIHLNYYQICNKVSKGLIQQNKEWEVYMEPMEGRTMNCSHEAL